MAAQVATPLLIIAGSLGVMGTFINAAKGPTKRQWIENNKGWENVLYYNYRIYPPRTKIEPYITETDDEVWNGRTIPYYGFPTSYIVPGSKQDPTGKPIPTPQQFEAERARVKSLGVEEDEIAPSFAEQPYKRTGLAAFFYPFDTDKDIPGSLRYARADRISNASGLSDGERIFAARDLYRTHPEAELARIWAWAQLHPEQKLDIEKFKKHFPPEKLQQFEYNW